MHCTSSTRLLGISITQVIFCKEHPIFCFIASAIYCPACVSASCAKQYSLANLYNNMCKKAIESNSFTISLLCVINLPLPAVQSKLIVFRIIDIALDVMILECSILKVKVVFNTVNTLYLIIVHYT